MAKRVVLAILVGLLVVPYIGCAPAEQEVYVLDFTTHMTASASEVAISKAFFEEIERRTDGRLRVNWHTDGTIATHTEALPAIRDGLAHGGHISTFYYPTEIPLTTVVDLVFMTSYHTEQGRAFEEVYAAVPALQEEWERNNMKLLFIGPNMGSVFLSNRRIESLEDFQGLKVRATGAIAEAITNLGCVPVALSGAEYYDGAARGIVEAVTALPMTSVAARRMYEVQDYLLDFGIGAYYGNLTVLNLDTWNSLPEDIQRVLTDIDFYGTTAQDYRDMLMQDWDTAMAEMEYLELSPEDEAAIRGLCGLPMWEEWAADKEQRGLPGNEVLQRYREAVEKYNKQPLIETN